MFDMNSFKKHGYYYFFFPYTQYSYKGNEINVYIDRYIPSGEPNYLSVKIQERPRAAVMKKEEIESALSLIGFDLTETYDYDPTMYLAGKSYSQKFSNTRIGKILHEQFTFMSPNSPEDYELLIQKSIPLIWPEHEEFCIHDYFFNNVKPKSTFLDDSFIGTPLEPVPVSDEEYQENMEFYNSFLSEKVPAFKKVFGRRKTAEMKKELSKQLDRYVMEKMTSADWRAMLSLIHDMYCIATIEAQIRYTPTSAHPAQWTTHEVQEKMDQLKIDDIGIKGFDFTKDIEKRNKSLKAKAC